MITKVIKKRGVNFVVSAFAEVAIPPSAPIGRWHRQLTDRVKRETAKEAPTNKRPRWAHYGKPLKSSITASTTSSQPSRGGGRVHSAVGSTAAHAIYVDQGTGIHGGGGPYQAKVLPPWLPVFDLYESTWRPSGPGGRIVKPVFIKGQKGQNFFDKGLRRAFRSLGDSRYRPISGALSAAVNTFPEGLGTFAQAAPSNSGFQAQLEEWRTWRDERWNSDGVLGPRGAPRAVKPPKVKPVKPPKPPKPVKPPKKDPPTLRDKQDAAVKVFKAQNPNIKVLGRINAGLVVNTAKGRYVIPWSRLYNLL